MCVVDDVAPVETSPDAYGSTYTPGANGPAAHVPESRVVASSDVVGECVAPPWWLPAPE